jgi:Na+/H+ antiporter NhaA
MDHRVEQETRGVLAPQVLTERVLPGMAALCGIVVLALVLLVLVLRAALREAWRARRWEHS